jgi:hypothetical protein
MVTKRCIAGIVLCGSLAVAPGACRAPDMQKPSPVAAVRSNTRCSPAGPLLPDTPHLLSELLASRPAQFKKILDNAGMYEVQILYTQINRDRENRPSFKHYSFRLNPRAYFNPASMVKLPVLCLALQKLNQLNVPGLDKGTHLTIGKQHACQTAVAQDPTAPGGRASIANYIKKVLLVSDNDAYNRLYEFLGQTYIYENLHAMGYPDARIIRRFCNCDYDESRYTNPFFFYNNAGQPVYAQPQQVSMVPLVNPLPNLKRGRGYIDSRGKYVAGPFDYTHSNNLSLTDVNSMLMAVMFPDVFPPQQRFGLTPDDYRFVYRYLCMLPGESDIQTYASNGKYPDNLKKFFVFGDAHGPRSDMRSGPVRVFNVVGKSDGYLSDCAYIVDFECGIEFFLSAVIYVNSDQVLKDGRYEYDSVGMPFLAELGRTVYEFERARRREFAPDLTSFKLDR